MYKQKKFRQRAFRNRFTINNPFITDDIKVLDPDNLTDEQQSLLGNVKHDYSYLREPQYEQFFEFRLAEYPLKDGQHILGTAVAERAFFKDYQAAQDYFKMIDFIDYVCFQYEQGASGTKHLQGFMHYKRQIDFKKVREIFPTIHLDPCYEVSSYYIDYCKKQDTKIEGYDFFEYGLQPPDERARTDMKELLVDIREGTPYDEMLEKYTWIMLNSGQKVLQAQQKIKQEKFKNIVRDVRTTYIYGKEGAGKTTFVERVLGHEPREVGIVGEYNTTGMFDEYEYQDVILFDEFDSQIELTKMNKWLDGRPCSLPARNHNRTACYTKVFIVSNYPLDKQYTKARNSGKEPSFKGFLRRINEIIYMPEMNTYIWEKGEPSSEIIANLNEQGAKYSVNTKIEQTKMSEVEE